MVNWAPRRRRPWTKRSSLSGKKKTTPEEALGALEEAALDAELARIKALSDDEINGELRKGRGDPDAIGRRGQEIAERAASIEELEAILADIETLAVSRGEREKKRPR